MTHCAPRIENHFSRGAEGPALNPRVSLAPPQSLQCSEATPTGPKRASALGKWATESGPLGGGAFGAALPFLDPQSQWKVTQGSNRGADKERSLGGRGVRGVPLASPGPLAGTPPPNPLGPQAPGTAPPENRPGTGREER